MRRRARVVVLLTILLSAVYSQDAAARTVSGDLPPDIPTGRLCVRDSDCVLPSGTVLSVCSFLRCNADRICVISRRPLAECCESDRECDDVDFCTLDFCSEGRVCSNLRFTPPGVTCCSSDSECDDHDRCNGAETCEAGRCVNGTPLDCGDSNRCTTDACDARAGCLHANNTDPCDDGDFCTDGDRCGGGACVGGAPRSCDDANQCTSDRCDASARACVNSPVSACCSSDPDCNDRDLCNGTERCVGNRCVAGTPAGIEDHDLCTADSCNSGDGRVSHVPIPVDDRDPCTIDACDSVRGVTHVPVSVDDGDVCTRDSCDILTGGVRHVPITGCCHRDTECSDGDACNGMETCVANRCAAGPPVIVNDNNACTTDTCNPSTGEISHLPISTDDNDVCTADSCNPSTGVSHISINADDGNDCTEDHCDRLTGPWNILRNGADCSEGDSCDIATCQWRDPACRLSCPGSIVFHYDARCAIDFTYAGLREDVRYQCTRYPSGDPALPVPLVMSPRRSALAILSDVQVSTTVSCQVMVDGKVSSPCTAEVDASSCGVDCRQPPPEGTKETFAGTPSACLLTDVDAGFTCHYDGQEVTRQSALGVDAVDTTTSGIKSVSVSCRNAAGDVATCQDTLIIEPVCRSLAATVTEDRVQVACDTIGGSHLALNFRGEEQLVSGPDASHCSETSFAKPPPGDYRLTGRLAGTRDTRVSVCPPQDITIPVPPSEPVPDMVAADVEIYFCMAHETEATSLSGRVIRLENPCPELPIRDILEPHQMEAYETVQEYRKDAASAGVLAQRIQPLLHPMIRDWVEERTVRSVYKLSVSSGQPDQMRAQRIEGDEVARLRTSFKQSYTFENGQIHPLAPSENTSPATLDSGNNQTRFLFNLDIAYSQGGGCGLIR